MEGAAFFKQRELFRLMSIQHVSTVTATIYTVHVAMFPRGSACIYTVHMVKTSVGNYFATYKIYSVQHSTVYYYLDVIHIYVGLNVSYFYKARIHRATSTLASVAVVAFWGWYIKWCINELFLYV